jgi:hypothetical protein
MVTGLKCNPSVRRRRGAAWLELLLVLAFVALVLQLLPSIPQRLLEALDFRYWSRWTWFVVNSGVLLLLLTVRFCPELIDSWRQRKTELAANATAVQPISRFQPGEDVRILMRRDEAFRTRLRRKFAFYGLLLPTFVIALGVGFAVYESRQEEVARRSNTLLHSNVGTDFRRDVTGVVGTKFRVRSDHDLHATQLGVFDSGGDGLQYEYRVGIFSVAGAADANPKNATLLAQATVPHGRHATLGGMFRWATLPTPVTLKANTDYILAAEAFGRWLGRGPDDEELLADSWPSAFDEAALQKDGSDEAWNALVIGEGGDEGRALLITDQPWPACPYQEEPTPQGIAHGLANLTVAESN